MPRCGDFSHMLLNVDEASFDGMRIVRCTIVDLDPKHNTVDVELGEFPVATVPPGELADTDCPDIPFFEGDGWSDDEERRRFNSVPIHYHCQWSTGTDADLKFGHMAFRVPSAELTNPPYTAEEVAEMHEQILRDKVYLVYIPPTATESAGGSLGHRFVIGHSDVHDVTPCKSEYLCVRIHDKFDVETEIDENENPNFGHSDPTKTIVAIVDPIGGRVYQGLERFGITFPCTAQTILDKVASITLDENTPQIDIDFLDTLHAITPLYQHAFVFQAPHWYKQFSTYVIYYFDPYGHQYHPTRLHWLTHFFDYNLQCADFTDKRLLDEPYSTCYLRHRNSGQVPEGYAMLDGEGNPIYPTAVLMNVSARDYELLSGGSYRTTFTDMNDNEVSYVQDAFYEYVDGESYTCNDHPCTDRECTFENWIYDDNRTFPVPGFYYWGPWHPQASFITITGSHNYTIVQQLYSYTTNHAYDYQVKLYAPWQVTQEVTEFLPWYEFSHDGESIPIALNSDAVAFGRRGSYAISAFVHGVPGNYTSRALFAYNNASYFGDTNDRHVSLFRPLPWASSFMTTLLGQMFAMHAAAGLTGYASSMEAFVIDVLE